MEMDGRSDAVKDYVAGVAAGIATVLSGHPFDTVKVRLQTQNTEAHSHRYRGAWHCTSHILKSEGVRGLYKGASSSFAGVAVESSLLFGLYTQIKTFLQGGERAGISLPSVIAAAGISGGAVSLVLCPTELVKCRLQVQEKAVGAAAAAGSAAPRLRYAGPWDCVRQTVRQDGVRGLFRGLRAAFYRESIGNSIFFTVHETTRYRLLTALGGDADRSRGSTPVKDALLEGATGVVSGGLAGVAFWAAVLPFDVVKTRLQTTRDPSVMFSPVGQQLVKLYRGAGFRGLYAGLGPTLVRAFPANAAAVATWELVARLLSSANL